jgi:hypothetical protein
LPSSEKLVRSAIRKSRTETGQNERRRDRAPRPRSKAHPTPSTSGAQTLEHEPKDFDTPPRGSLDEKIVRKKNIPFQIIFWVGIVLVLYFFYRVFSGH